MDSLQSSDSLVKSPNLERIIFTNRNNTFITVFTYSILKNKDSPQIIPLCPIQTDDITKYHSKNTKQKPIILFKFKSVYG